jgi:hypothetical protein
LIHRALEAPEFVKTAGRPELVKFVTFSVPVFVHDPVLVRFPCPRASELIKTIAIRAHRLFDTIAWYFMTLLLFESSVD